MEAELEELYFGEDQLPRPQGGGNRPRCMKTAVPLMLYIDFLKKIAPDLSGVHLAMDCGHGAVYKLAPQVLSRAWCQGDGA
jgi:phosphoglucosamine mutase